MCCLFPFPTDKMTTFYSIHAYNPESRNPGEDKIHDGILYKGFEKACEAIHEKIDFYIEYWNNHESDTPEEFEVPNVEEMKKDIEKRKYVNYYECDSGWVWVIRKWDVSKSEEPSCENCDHVKPLRLYPSRSDPNVWYRYCDECFPC
jgi:hypothetical protein